MRLSPRARWTTAITLMLLFPVTLYAFAFYLTASDSSFMVERNYEHRAEHYDEEMRIKTDSARLGWTVAIDSETAQGRIELTIDDSEGHAVNGAQVSADVFHAARASAVEHVIAADGGGGKYSFPYVARQTGFHVLRIEATRGADRFDTELRRYLTPERRDGVPR